MVVAFPHFGHIATQHREGGCALNAYFWTRAVHTHTHSLRLVEKDWAIKVIERLTEKGT